MKKLTKTALVATLLTASAVSHAASNDSGLYVTGSLGQAHTTLDTSNTQHATQIVSDSTDKLGYSLGLGYRFNTYVGAEASYVNFGKPSYNLVRGTTGETSTMTVKNEAFVLAAQGYLPVSDSFSLTGKAGLAFVHTDVNRESPFPDDAYHVQDNQMHPTYGIGGLYKVNQNLAVRANVDWYPKITKTNDNATDTNAYMLSAGLQYTF
ncbi:hypothetical protein B0T49_20300 [Chromobacterium violaceum]|uniref:outer membrane beta-barrel protein n=1 Tax=Chromobacterium violaceum TaxID=536 RepID=UPI0009DAE7E2|nr:outer membrane beta-barrel protein [Chromobacterium violaceum]OQS45772.1 hypothetical protein B0T48_17945 [Chromobacterium violaceum]OQS46206.1 hypothetical protein B0T49_20300 [Chromobacterium violaceum]